MLRFGFHLGDGPWGVTMGGASGGAGPAPLASIASAYGVTFDGGQDVGIKPVVSGYEVWSDLGSYWLNVLRFDTGTGRSSNRGRRLVRSVNTYPVSACTRSGFGSTLTSAGSGYTVAYMGGAAAHSAIAGDYIEAEVSGEGDLYVVYTGRTNGGHARVDIDGSQALVNELSDLGGGYQAFHTLADEDLTRRMSVKVASGLAQGTYTVRVTVAGATSGTDNRIYIEGVAITQRPSLADKIEPPAWAAGVPVITGQEFQHNGYFYRARLNGTTGATAPTHTSGTGTDDGTMDYNVWPFSTYHFIERYTDYASEREYALEATITATDDIGGQTHGNEETVSSSITLDGSPVNLGTASMTAIDWGAEIVLSDELTWTHTDDASMAAVDLTRTLSPGRMDLTAEVTIDTATVDLGWFYTAMHPAVVYNGSWGHAGFDEVKTDDGTTYDLLSYDGVSQDFTKEDVGAIAYKLDVAGGRLVSAIVGGERDTMFLRANLNADTFGTGTWQTKAYIRRASTAEVETATQGQVLTFSASHVEGVA